MFLMTLCHPHRPVPALRIIFMRKLSNHIYIISEQCLWWLTAIHTVQFQHGRSSSWGNCLTHLYYFRVMFLVTHCHPHRPDPARKIIFMRKLSNHIYIISEQCLWWLTAIHTVQFQHGRSSSWGNCLITSILFQSNVSGDSLPSTPSSSSTEDHLHEEIV